MTTQEQLSQINNAISAIENGAQEYRIGSRQLKRADLSVLYAERRKLQQQYAQECEVPTNVFVVTFDRR